MLKYISDKIYGKNKRKEFSTSQTAAHGFK
jgi:hypothetical protein